MNDLVENNIDWLSKENKIIIKNQFFPQGASDGDMKYCIGVAKAFNLNPILKQIYFVPRKTKVNNQWVEKVEPVAGRDSFLTLAHRSNKFAGIESKVEIKETPILKDGKWTRENDLVATAKVYRTDTKKTFTVSVNYREYVQKTREGIPTKFWKDKPETMLKKVAESQCLRKAFDISGLNAVEEINDIQSEVVATVEPTQEFNTDTLQTPKVESTKEILLKRLAQVPADKANQLLIENEDKWQEWLKDDSEMQNLAMELLF